MTKLTFLATEYQNVAFQGLIQDSPEVGPQPSGEGGANLGFCQNFAKTLHEIVKSLGREGGGAGVAPLRSATALND